MTTEPDKQALLDAVTSAVALESTLVTSQTAQAAQLLAAAPNPKARSASMIRQAQRHLADAAAHRENLFASLHAAGDKLAAAITLQASEQTQAPRTVARATAPRLNPAEIRPGDVVGGPVTQPPASAPAEK